MAQWVEVLVAKPDNLSSILPSTWWKEKERSCKSSPDLHSHMPSPYSKKMNVVKKKKFKPKQLNHYLFQEKKISECLGFKKKVFFFFF